MHPAEKLKHVLSYRFYKAFILMHFALIFILPEVYAQPVISNFNPASGPVGATVTITGSGFHSNPDSNFVYFGAVRANVLSATDSSLMVTVPFGSSYHPITITTGRLTAYSEKPFAVTFTGSPVITTAAFTPQTSYISGKYPISVVMSDFDGDGKADIATANDQDNSISVYRNNGGNAFSFQPKTDYMAGTSPVMLATADFNGDGKTDIAVANFITADVSVFNNNSTKGNISFLAAVNYQVGSVPICIITDDFDRDGKPDIATANSQGGSVSILKNAGKGNGISFLPRVDFQVGKNPYSVSSGDFNKDGKPDLVVACYEGTTISVLKNISAATINFAPKQDFPTTEKAFFATVADFDSDSFPDFAVVYVSAGATLDIYRNNSNGDSISFEQKITYPSREGAFVIAADINGDAKPELGVAHFGAGTFSVYNNNSIPGRIAFLNPVNISIQERSFSVALADLDEDSKPDLVAVNYSLGNFKVYKNTIDTTTAIIEPVIHSFNPVAATAGTSVTLKGLHFTGATEVSFGGVSAASFSVQSDSVIVAVVGAGATGSITVVSPAGIGSVNGFVFGVPTGIVALDNQHYISFGPNPVKGLLHINFRLPASTLLNIELYDLQGKSVGRWRNVRNNTDLDMEALPLQLYLIRITDIRGKQLHVGKMMKQ